MSTTATMPIRTCEQAEALANAIADLVRVIQFRDRDRACCYGLSVSQCYALQAVCDEPAMGVNDLAASLYLDKSTASRVLDGLVELGLVRKERDPDDGRAWILSPTAKGVGLNRDIQEELVQEYGVLLSDLDEGAQWAVVDTVRNLARTFASRVEVSQGSCCVVR